MDIKEILAEFKAFALKGNVVDLAVAVVIGKAFGDVVQAVVTVVITPLTATFLRLLPTFISGSLALLVNSVITFFAIATVVFFGVVKPIGILTMLAKKKAEEAPAEPPLMPADIVLLTEIRDLLKTKSVS